MFNKITRKLKYYSLIISSLRFNFHYLPFKQAIHTPIFVYNMNCLDGLRGGVKIEANHIRRGMISLGHNECAMYPKGIKWENNGLVVFKGCCRIGNGAFVSIGRHGTLTIGDNVVNTAALKVICAKSITIGDNTRLGWETLIMDTSFHPLYDRTKEKFLDSTRPITIGANNWMGLQTIVMPGTTTSDHCLFGLRSILSRNFPYEPYSLYGGTPLRLLRSNVERILGKDQIEY